MQCASKPTGFQPLNFKEKGSSVTTTLLLVVDRNPVQSVGAGTHLFPVEQTSVPVQSPLDVHVTPPVPPPVPVPPVPVPPVPVPVVVLPVLPVLPVPPVVLPVVEPVPPVVLPVPPVAVPVPPVVVPVLIGSQASSWSDGHATPPPDAGRVTVT